MSSTFSIDFALSAKPEPDDAFDVLRSMHEKNIDSILPPFESALNLEYGGNPHNKSLNPGSTLSSSTIKQSITDLDGKPQFNLASAEALLEHFRSMIPHLPCIEIPQNTTVQMLASTSPFLLLAILTSASATKTLQGYNLYDAEFRKVLGLK